MAERKTRPRLTDVARAAGISKTAASYVLNGRLGVSEETRDRVLEVAQQLGYRHRGTPYGPMAGMAAGTIGVALSPTRYEAETPNYFVAELLSGVDFEARRQRHQLRVAMWDPAAGIDTLRGVDGLLFLGGAFDPEVLRRLHEPLVLVGSSFSQVSADAVLADNRQAIYLATAHLLARGRRRLVLLNGPAHSPTTLSKEIGYRDALDEWDLASSGRMLRADFSTEAGESAARSVLTAAGAPDGIVAGDDVIAIGVLHAAQSLGVRVPDDLAVVGFGDSPAGALVRPALSSVRLFLRQMGALSVRRLLDRLRGSGREDPMVRSLVSPELLVRASSVGNVS